MIVRFWGGKKDMTENRTFGKKFVISWSDPVIYLQRNINQVW